jgi:protein gp37
LNKQFKVLDGEIVTKGKIEWTNVFGPGTGYTWNPVGGCYHGCEWIIGGETAQCYAKTVAEKFGKEKGDKRFFQNGFEHHYWHPERLSEPVDMKKPCGIFLDSMSDLMGKWVREAEIEAVLNVVEEANWHQFQMLTKNAPRLMTRLHYPSNLWVGVSMPPSIMFGKELTPKQQYAFMRTALTVLNYVDAPVKWISFEPLSFDVAPLIEEFQNVIQWAVIGAATIGPKKIQPETEHVESLLAALDKQGVPVFFKGNLDWPIRREEFPALAG